MLRLVFPGVSFPLAFLFLFLFLLLPANLRPAVAASRVDDCRSITSEGARWIRAYHPGARKPYWDQKRTKWKQWAKWIREA